MGNNDDDCTMWRPIVDGDGDCGDWSGSDNWILKTGYWDDTGVWRDLAYWNDGRAWSDAA